MTVSSATSKSGPYAGAGTTGPFAIGFRFLDNTHLRVVKTSAAGVESTLVLTTDYSVSGAGLVSGSVTLVTALAVGEKLTIVRNVPATQEADYVQNDPFPAESHETALDKLTMLVQQVAEVTDRSIKVNVSDAPLSPLPGPAARANMLVGFDAAGGSILYPTTTSVGAGDMRIDTFVDGVDFTAGATTVLTLSREPGNPANLEVFFDGIFQGPDQWAVSAATLTFTSAIPGGVTRVYARIGTTLSTQIPPAGSVGASQMAANAIKDINVDPTAGIQSSKLSFLRDDASAVAIPVKTRLSQTVDITDFGGMNLLDGVTVAAPALLAAIQTGKRVRIPYTAAGINLGAFSVEIGTGQMIEFENPSMIVKSQSATAAFRMTGYGEYPKATSGIFGGCTFDMTGAPVGSTAIRFGTSTGVVWGVRVDDGRYTFTNCYEAIGDEAHATNYITDCQLSDFFIRNPKGRSVYIRRSRGFLVFNDFYLDNTANTAPITWEGARFEDMVGIVLNSFEVSGGGLSGASYQAAVIGLVVNGTGQAGVRNSYLRVNRLLIDNTYGNGFLFNHLRNVKCDDLVAYQNLGYGGKIQDCADVEITNTQYYGALGVTGASASQTGLELISCDGVLISNAVAEYNTGNGIQLTDTLHSSITNWNTNNNFNIGFVEIGTSNVNKNSHGFSYNNANGAGSAGSSISIGASSAVTTTSDFTPHSGTPTQWNVGTLSI